jgi:hypothetical protein
MISSNDAVKSTNSQNYVIGLPDNRKEAITKLRATIVENIPKVLLKGE